MKPIPFVRFCEDVLGVTFEPAQRVFYSVAADRVQPTTLVGAERDIAAELFGGIFEIPDEAFRTVAVIKGAGIGWSYFGGLRLLHRALTAPRLDAAMGEIRPALAVAPDLKTGRIPVRAASGAAMEVPSIKALIESEAADGFVIRREGGWFTSVEALPAAVGGRATRGRRYVEALLDEASFFRDPLTGKVNDSDLYQSVFARCTGTVWVGSTPWLPTALVHKLFEANFGN